MRRKLVVWGAGGHALVVADIIRMGIEYEIVGFLDDVDRNRKGTTYCGSVVLGGKEILDDLSANDVRHLIIGVGDCDARLHLSELARARGFSLATAIHPAAIVAKDVNIGAGAVVAAGAVINPQTQVGENVIINTSSSIDHECVIENAVHIGPGVHLGGRVHVGSAAWIGMGSIISDHVRIGNQSIVGAGSVVLQDIPERVVAYGVPAKVQRRI